MSDTQTGVTVYYSAMCMTELHEYCSGYECACHHHVEVALRRDQHGTRRSKMVATAYHCYESMYRGAIKGEQELSEVLSVAFARLQIHTTTEELKALATVIARSVGHGWSLAEVHAAIFD